MKLSQILSESEARLQLLVKKYPKVPLLSIQRAFLADPEEGRYTEWIVRQLNNGKIRLPEDSSRIWIALNTYDSVKRQPRLLRQYGALPDINKYDMRALEDLCDKIEGRTGVVEQNIEILPGSNKIYDDGTYAIVQIETESPQTAVEYSKGTRWCTSDIDIANDYLNNTGLWIVFKNGKKYAQTDCSDQVMDLKNEPIRDNNLAIILSKVAGFLDPKILSGPCPELEPYFKRDPGSAMVYARDVLQKRWPEAEPTILQDMGHAMYYAKDVIRGRWPELEDIIKDDPRALATYLVTLHRSRWLKGRLPEVESTIIKDPWAAANYAVNVIEGRWPEAESTILQDKESKEYYESFMPINLNRKI